MSSLQVHIERDIRAREAAGRTVTVSHARPATGRGHTHYCYGDAITGRPIIQANVVDAPRNQEDVEWLREYLPSYIGPGGTVNLDYDPAIVVDDVMESDDSEGPHGA
ncbi:hypothetical protein [Arthrobacter sp. SD76]|uniref:hypothetical protein n=1 Tax=Arthrobacter sp. SD76 TaxID=3415007 RepID=UPI003C76157D